MALACLGLKVKVIGQGQNVFGVTLSEDSSSFCNGCVFSGVYTVIFVSV